MKFKPTVDSKFFTLSGSVEEYQKPVVAFPFEPLTELAAECAKNFNACPLAVVPPVFISPANYFQENVSAFYHQPSKSIYFKDSFVSGISPEGLASAMMLQLVDAWIHQKVFNYAMVSIGDPRYRGAHEAITRVLNVDQSAASTVKDFFK
jgi:hypothetical protein